MKHKVGAAWLWIVYIFLYAPIAIVIIYSFNEAKYTAQWKGFTLGWYKQLMANKPLMDAAVNSISVATLSASFSTLLGVLAALCIRRYSFPGRNILYGSIYVLTVSPDIVMGVSLLFFFVFFNIKLGFFSLFVAHTTLSLPFVTLIILTRLFALGEDLIEAARDLGASEVQAFRHVILPSIMPGVFAGWLLSFTLSMDDVLISFFVAGPAFEVLPLKIYSMVRLGVQPDINALSAIMFCVTVFFVCLAWVVLRPTGRKYK